MLKTCATKTVKGNQNWTIITKVLSHHELYFKCWKNPNSFLQKQYLLMNKISRKIYLHHGVHQLNVWVKKKSKIFKLNHLEHNKLYKLIIWTKTAQGPVVQSIVSLTSSLVVKMLTVLVSTISNSQVFLLKKCEKLLQMQKLLTFFSKNISVFAIFNDQSFNDMLPNNISSFEFWTTEPRNLTLKALVTTAAHDTSNYFWRK